MYAREIEDTEAGRLSFLRDVLDFSRKHSPNATRLRDFSDFLRRGAPKLFTGNMLLESSEYGKFVTLLDTAGKTTARVRWPFERLFVLCKAAIIPLSASQGQALVIPFATGSHKRYVVLMYLRNGELDAGEWAFLRLLECTVGRCEMPSLISSGGLDRIRASDFAAEPRIVWYGRMSPLARRIKAILHERGWQMFDTLPVLDPSLVHERERPDVIILSEENSDRGSTLLRSLRFNDTLALTPIVFFSSKPDDTELQILADRCLPLDASKKDIFDGIKALVRGIPDYRRAHLMRAIHRMKKQYECIESYAELAQTIVDHAIKLGGEWVCVQVFDKEGQLHMAQERPPGASILTDIPEIFLSGYAVMQSDVDESFFDECIEDEEVREELHCYGIRSAVILPFVCGARVTGAVTIFNRARLDEPEFDALREMGAFVRRALVRLRTTYAREKVTALVKSVKSSVVSFRKPHARG